VKLWSVAHLVDNDDKLKLLHSTSNGLESYNKHFNHFCPTSHPNLVTLAHALHQEADGIVQRMDDVAKGRETPPDYSDHVFPKILPEFYNKNKKPSAKESLRKGCSKRGGK
jgi:hypothetical protein